MLDRILHQMRDKIRTRSYIMSLHAEEEMDNDNLSIFDVERVVLSGEIIERQEDRDTDEWKYLIQGRSFTDRSMVVVIKFGPTDKLIIITVYAE